MTNPEAQKIESEKSFWLKDKEKDEKDKEVFSEKKKQAVKLSEQAKQLADEGLKEGDETKIQEAREMLAKASKILEEEEAEKIRVKEVQAMLEGREDKEILEKLFVQQKQELIDLGYPEALGIDKDEFFAKYIEPLRKELVMVPKNISEGNLHFLIVIPNNILHIEKKMLMVKLGEESGNVWHDFNFEELKNVDGVKTPEKPYLIFDVESGYKTKGMSADDCVKQLDKETRRGLTAQEGVDLVIHYPKILKDHYIDLPGSEYGSEDVQDVPYLWTHGGCPKFNHYPSNNVSHNWGSASCRKIDIAK